MRAPWWRTCCSTSARPRPEPSPLVDSRRAKGAKIRSRSASAMPGPSSSTISSGAAVPPGRAASSVTRTWPSGRPWRTAFSTRLSASSRSPGSQPSIATGASGSSALRSQARVALDGRGRRGVDDLGEVDLGELERPGVAARQGLQAVEELDEAPLLGQRVAEHLRAALGRAGRGGARASTAWPARWSAACAARGPRRRRSAASRPGRACGRRPSARGARASR